MARLGYKIYSSGCKVNQSDGDKLGGLLKSAGFILAKNNTDLAIVNSCAVTASAITKSRAMVKKARQENPGAKIILSGCWPRAYVAEAKELGVDLVWTGKDDGFLKKLRKELAPAEFPERGLYRNSAVWQSPEAETLPWPKKHTKFKILNSKYKKAVNGDSGLILTKDNQQRSRYFLKIQDGCEQFCSYCIIPYTRGKLQSRKISEVVAEAEAAVRAGWQEIVLNGIHLGLYGVNNKLNKIPLTLPASHGSAPLPRGDLLELLKKLVKIEGLKKIRLSSIERG